MHSSPRKQFAELTIKDVGRLYKLEKKFRATGLQHAPPKLSAFRNVIVEKAMAQIEREAQGSDSSFRIAAAEKQAIKEQALEEFQNIFAPPAQLPKAGFFPKRVTIQAADNFEFGRKAVHLAIAEAQYHSRLAIATILITVGGIVTDFLNHFRFSAEQWLTGTTIILALGSLAVWLKKRHDAFSALKELVLARTGEVVEGNMDVATRLLTHSVQLLSQMN